MSGTLDLYITIYEEENRPSHWALFFDDGSLNDKTLLSVKYDHRSHLKFHTETRNPRILYNQDELILVGTFNATDISKVNAIARGIRPEDLHIDRLNCIRYVRDVLDTLEVNRIVGNEVVYWIQKSFIRARMEKGEVDYEVECLVRKRRRDTPVVITYGDRG
ncbi:hypothetical protein BO94DRAFT_625963 [Aspergillus sclerotioniger CBS 115572]|uniref:Uncharacterized protein n=1 Tax=Aspergillus sclerotioniger CBS 115572 TaxID=1450535 RepID=A0A317W745_9EURO|nr:hypothetical protein BO94DRAFT_625963 [Aspergillus sclerotioniger CBS 115572]PWY80838.1 hypothetical protein BO94DRAFT_625963 [Aspergillus sclerotioniger CBS 115572]